HFEGESMGAGIAFELGMRHPTRCGKLILNSGSYYVRFDRKFEPPPDAPPGGVEYLMRLCRAAVTDPSPATQRARLQYLVANPARITDELVDLYARLYADPAIHASMERVYGMTAPRGNLAGWTEAEAHTLQLPTMVLWTDQNKGQSPEMGAYLAGLLPHATFQ